MLRLPVVPDACNGLTAPSWIMVDKVVTAPRVKVGRRIGALSPGDFLRLTRALAVFLGIVGAYPTPQYEAALSQDRSAGSLG